jgi:hypothetical protein
MRKVLIVCINPESGRYLAVDSDDVTKFEFGHTKGEALAQFVLAHCTDWIQVSEITVPA